LYSFEDFVFDTDQRELRRGSRLIPLQPQVFDVLEYLIVNRLRVVSKDDLIEAVWGRRIVSESALTTRINAVRTAIGDSGEAQRLIRTLPRKGFRFIGAAIEQERVVEPVPRAPGGTRAESERSRAPARRQVTVLSCEFVISRPRSGQLEPEDLQTAINECGRHCAETVAQFGGRVVHNLGHKLLAVFGYPAAHEDDAERSVHAGLALSTTLPQVEIGTGLTGQACIGVATGVVVTGVDIAGAPAHADAILGDAPRIAEFLQGIARPGQVVIASSTRRLVRGLFQYRDLEPMTPKAFDEPLHASQVLGTSNLARFEAWQEGSSTPLVGREEECDLLLRRWRQAGRGEGRVVLLGGEAGIGKSRLAVVLAEGIEGEPHAILRYACSSRHSDNTLFPIIAQLERMIGFERTDAPAGRLLKLECFLERSGLDEAEAAPLIGHLLSLPVADRYPVQELSPQKRKEKVFAILLTWLERLAEQGPLLLVFEDAHWIDPTSLDFLSIVAERMAGLPVLLVITARPEFAPSFAGAPHVTSLVLSRLSPADVAAMVAQITGDRVLPKEVIEQIAARADGVPLFVEELTKSILEGSVAYRGETTGAPGATPQSRALPSSLHDSLMPRLDRLGLARDVAQVGAALGREFSHELIAAVMSMPQEQLDDALNGLVKAGLIFRRGAPPDAEYSFKHALIQDLAHASLIRPARQQLHARIAATLEETFPVIAAAQPERLAHHHLEAGAIEAAVAYRLKAGIRASTRSAMTEAEAQLRNGLELLSRVPESRARHYLELQLQSALGNVLFVVKGFAAPESARAYSRVRELSGLVGETVHLPRMTFGLWLLHGNGGEARVGRELAEDLLRMGERSKDPATLTMGHLATGGYFLVTGDFLRARSHIEQLLELHDPALDSVGLIGVDAQICGSSWLPLSLLMLGLPDQAREQAEKVRSAARARAHGPTSGWCLSAICRFYAILGIEESFASAVAEFATLATNMNFPLWLAQAVAYRGWMELRAGNVKHGLELLEKGVFEYKGTGAISWLPFLLSLLAAGHRANGDAASEMRTLNEAINLAARRQETWFDPELRRLIGLVPGMAPRDSERHLVAALDLGRQQRSVLFQLRASVSIARLWMAEGRRGEARDLLKAICCSFVEGYATPDLMAAAELLSELG
jgi:DNA-binding winged helix-turn-helix (wHTH) protein